MDTREKIVASDQIANITRRDEWIIIAGLFDPLTETNANYITQMAAREPGRRVLVIILEAKLEHLPAAARAALVAALRCVDLVSVAALEDLPMASDRIHIINDLALGLQHSQDFVELVLASQKAGS